MTIGLCTDNDDIWEVYREQFKHHLSDFRLITDNINKLEWDPNIILLRLTPKNIELESCGYDFYKIINK